MTAFLAAHKVAIGLAMAILPTLITGLSSYPKAQGVFRALLDLLSFATHKDSPNSLKLPLLQRSRRPGGGAWEETKPTGGAAVLPIAMLSLLSTVGCCHGVTCKQIETAVVDCGTTEMKQTMEMLAAQVFQILTGNGAGGAANYRQDLAILETSFGAAVGCTVQELFGQLTQAKPGTILPTDSKAIVARADAYLKAKAPTTFKVAP